jgi:hypothetical protein
MAGDAPEKFDHVIAFDHGKRQVYLFRQGFHAFQALLVFRIGVDIGVIPEAFRFVSLLPPV